MPDKLLRKFGGKPKTWLVYTRDEAIDEGLEFVYWREAEEGDWCLTDDGYVTQLVRRSKAYTEAGPSGATRCQLTFPFCRRWEGTQELLYEDYRDSDTPPWLREELGRERWKRALNMYARILIEKGYPMAEADMHAIGMAYRPDQRVPQATFLRVLRYKEARDMLARELEGILEARGVTREAVVDMWKEAFDTAKETGNSATMRSVAKDLSELLDMKPKEATTGRNIPLNGLDWSALEEPEDVKELPPHGEEG
jgi:hypothetical protein